MPVLTKAKEAHTFHAKKTINFLLSKLWTRKEGERRMGEGKKRMGKVGGAGTCSEGMSPFPF